MRKIGAERVGMEELFDLLETSGVRAVVFDVYQTLLEVSAGPGDAEERWLAQWPRLVGTMPSGSMADFDAACRLVVARDHSVRKAAGERWPEVDWRSVACRAAPDLGALDRAGLDAFLGFHAGLQRSTRAMPGALDFLAELRGRGVLTGIASNAQGYTLTEMEAAGFLVGGFTEGLCFWSFELGFSKPDPRVFGRLTAALERRGILPKEVLMVGDRLDNDIEPARTAGWRTWHFKGSWPAL
jgi:FMN phosphatase YigB (HAD superfamily)